MALSGCFLIASACAPQPEVLAEEIRSALAKDQMDEQSLAELRQSMTSGAKALIEALPDGQRRQAAREFEDNERQSWDFWPSRFPGVRMDKMTPEHRGLADRLLRIGLSTQGYEKLKLIQALEPYNPWHSPYYSVLVFGDLAAKAWGWRFQGHHLSLNFTLVNGETIANTPLFMGTQPLSKSGIGGGKAPLSQEEDLARKLYLSLDSTEKQRADIKRPPHTYLPERSRKAERQQPLGVPSATLREPQREDLLALIRAYVHNVAPSIAAERWREIEQAGIDHIGFAWAGSDRKGRNHYYRIQGPTFIIEYDSRDGGSHIHSVWRSFDGDFGEDILRRHYQTASAGHGH